MSATGATARRWSLALAALLALALVVGAGVRMLLDRPDTYAVTADFVAAPGIYPGNSVKLLGVPVGTVSAVDPGVDGVELTLTIDEPYAVPPDVTAYLMAPNAVNDRFIELGPVPADAGPRMEDGDHIERQRTVVPPSVDDIIDNLDLFARTMGPQGANADGSLSTLLSTLADRFGGTGGTLNESIENLGTTFEAVTDDTDDIANTLNNLGELTTAASEVSGTYRSFASNLADVSTALANDAPAIGQVLANLQEVLTELNTFVKNNRQALAGTVTSLSRVAHQVGRQQKALGQLLEDTPLAVANLRDAVTQTPQGPALAARLTQVRGSKLGEELCGDGLLRLLLVGLEPDPQKRDVTDLACGMQRWLDEMPRPASAPEAPNFTLAALNRLGTS